MAYYLMLFAAGFAGSFHCIGMCGGFACALGRDPDGHAATVLRQLLYNTRRLTTYCFLAGLAPSPVASSTPSCPAPWSMPSSPRLRAAPERFPAFSPWRRLDWGPSP